MTSVYEETSISKVIMRAGLHQQIRKKIFSASLISFSKRASVLSQAACISSMTESVRSVGCT